ncbi:TIGR01244 family sulfur transferase [Chelativorans sp. M5D2P16]|uniref:TIGR01244 family sulfur transferase n=1 Tax=Chelativorans sp. M5D2P16 TaxID=3095678 RepID=UPI002ACA10DD|nr:TIGR01244 family sulfur transferase [Chelativorans sp. M5D2P16]MDZ5700048.1 TIGR01244 family sulfur transferase [Chelativorans sp. M5D2P16]
MDIRQVNEDFAVTGQIAPAQVSQIADAGFKSIVCNRPDTEEGAVPHDMVEEAARAAGLDFRFIPVVSGAITEDDVRRMAGSLEDLPRPVLAYCRSGARCLNLYALVQEMKG